jgi:probable F420-dependent oxidoreductase
MKVDGGIGGFDTAADLAKMQEEQGYDGLWTAETSHNPFYPLLLASQKTERIQLGTGIAVAFARNPMITAMDANDIQLASKGRHLLGLGSQIKPHIEKRFSMPWSHPAPRMREFVLAMRAIWDSWNNGSKLDFRGDFYSHTLMTPFFNPGPNPYGPPKVFLAAVGEHMTEVAGEVCDGLLVHPFSTERYMKEVTLPALQRGLDKAGKSRADVELSYTAFVVTGSDKEAEAAAGMVRSQVSFYGSTPAYRPVLDLHGWGDLQTELNTLSKQGKWADMAALITDDILETFAVVAPLDQVADKIVERYGSVIDRTGFYVPISQDPDARGQVIKALQNA